MTNKTDRLQIRVSPEQAQFLRKYADDKDVTISQMIRDFIAWLERREDGAQKENQN